MDGISMITPGKVKEQTSLEHTSETEENIRTGNNTVKDVDQLSVNNRINEKKEKQRQNNENFEDGFSEEEQEESDLEQEQTDEHPESSHKEYQPSDYENFYVKIKSEDDTVELYDKITDNLIETISADELSKLVSRLNIASGIFVNKRI